MTTSLWRRPHQYTNTRTVIFSHIKGPQKIVQFIVWRENVTPCVCCVLVLTLLVLLRSGIIDQILGAAAGFGALVPLTTSPDCQ